MAYTPQEWIDYPNPGYSKVNKARMDHIEAGIDAAAADADTALALVGGRTHGDLAGLDADDHPQYAKADGTRGAFAAPLGSDDNYVTDAEKTKLANLSGTNTGDQDLSGYLATADAPELIRDTMGTALVAGSGVTITPDDVGDTITLTATGAQQINAQTGTAYTPVAADAGNLVTLDNAAAITVTLPQDTDLAFAVGKRIDFMVLGAGMVTFAAGTGATVNATPSAVTRAQYSTVSAIKRAANTWILAGDLA